MAKKKSVMVCVTRQKNCERLIQEGARLGDEHSLPVLVVHVAARGQNFLGNDSDAETLEFLYQSAKDVDADMHVLRAENVMDTLVHFAKKMGAHFVVLGQSPEPQENDFPHRLQAALPEGTSLCILEA